MQWFALARFRVYYCRSHTQSWDTEPFMASLRDRLRADMAPRHKCVDRAYSELDLAHPAGLRTFLRAQLSVLLSMRCDPGHHAAAAQDLVSRMAAAMEADLRGLDSCAVVPASAIRLNATAVLYMLLGSSLGTRVLRRRWLEATEPAVRAAGQYLSLAPPQGAWRHLCEELAAHPAEGAEADRIVQAAGELFDLHLAVMERQALLPEGTLHV